MKFSERWLRSLVTVEAEREALVEGLTLAGLEVESVVPLGEELDGVVVGEIVACVPHPAADRLRICTVVAAGTESSQVVCGAPNARVGLRAPLALPGARLPGGVQISVTELRGIQSQGMLCSARELALDGDDAGLMELPEDAPVGHSLAEYLGLPDASIELKLTPNRADCFSMIGLAHDVAALFGGAMRLPDVSPVAAQNELRRDVSLIAGEACPRYCGRIIDGVDARAPTPLWMTERLRRAGLRPISAIVDVTNYVMLELGQPLHAFDDETLDGSITVRPGTQGERLHLLDGTDVKLGRGELVIGDARGAQALAGVMGGAASAVGLATKRIFLESAHFAPAAIMGVARRHGLHSDAAHRFERGVDPELPRRALERATALLLAVCGGCPGPLHESVLPGWSPERVSIRLRRARLVRVLGVEVPDPEVERILLALDLKVAREAWGWLAIAPTRRFDLAREEDLIEEVARIHGYARIPPSLPLAGVEARAEPEGTVPLARVRGLLAARDWREAVNLSLVGELQLQSWGLQDQAMPLANPLSSELSSMRPSLLPALVASLRANRNRQQARVRIFEVGRSFHAKPSPGREVERLAMAACGSATREQWGAGSRPLDFHDMKGEVEALLGLRAPGSPAMRLTREGLPPWLHPGRAACVVVGDTPVGVVGSLHPELERNLALEAEIYVAEFDLDALRAGRLPRPMPLPRFPAVRRDLAVMVPEAVGWDDVAQRVVSAAGALLAELCLFDVYRGVGLEAGHKSFAMGLILQDHSRTLTDSDADACLARVLQVLAQSCAARIRG